MVLPVLNDTASIGERIAEQDLVGTGDPVSSNVDLTAYMYTSKICKISVQCARDSAFDIESVLMDMLVERIGRKTNLDFTVGTGSGQPQGLVAGATAGVTTASGSAITFDEILALEATLDLAYIGDGTDTKFMMNFGTLNALRGLADGNGVPLWSQGDYVNKQPQTLHGFPIVINPDMPAMTTGLVPILFGNFKKGFRIRDILGEPVLFRFDETYMDRLNIGFLAYGSHGSGYVDPAAVRKLTMA